MPARGSVLVAFACVVLIGGTNFVAVRLSNRELAPFWGAGLRFALAAALLIPFAVWRRIPLPPWSAWRWILLYGLLNFGATYAVAYWGLVQASAAVGATLVALAPLLTFFLATAIGLERFRWAGLAGGVVSLAGIAIVFADQLHLDVPLAALIALVLNALGIGSVPVVIKRMPHTHPIGTNAVAMVPGALSLLLLSALAHETPRLPAAPDVALAFAYLVTIGSIGLFGGVMYVVQHWTASASSYMTVLFPVVTVIESLLIAGESVTWQLVAGALLVIVGTYIGAILQPTAGRTITRRGA